MAAYMIEVHPIDGSGERIINAKWIQEIRKKDNETEIYFAYNFPGACCQDYVVVKEEYDEMYDLLYRNDIMMI